MKFKTADDTTYYFLLDQGIFERLKGLGWENGIYRYGKNNLKFDVVCFFVHLISYRGAVARETSEYGYVRLKAEIMKRYHHKYNLYLQFLEENGFIKTRAHSIKNKRSKGYKLIKPNNSRNFIKYLPQDFVIRKNLSQDKLDKKSKADKTTGHLTRWLTPEHLTVNYQEGLNYLEGVKMKDSKKYSRRYLLEMLKNGFIYYQRQGKDNRLHSILSNLPKDMRRIVCFKEKETLVSCDIKSSQPFLLAGILNLLFGYKNCSSSSSSSSSLLNLRIQECISSIVDRKVRKRISTCISTMMQQNLESLDTKGIQRFVNLVTRGDLYEYLAANFSEKLLRKIQTPLGVSDQFFNQSLEYKEWVYFQDLREYAKKAVMEYLYSSTKNKEMRCREVRRLLPHVVSQVVDEFKSGDKTHFPIFLQNLEAKLILDKITRKISLEHPDIPLYTIHDSIITTASNATLVNQYLEEGLREFFGISPIIDVEEWLLKIEEAPIDILIQPKKT